MSVSDDGVWLVSAHIRFDRILADVDRFRPGRGGILTDADGRGMEIALRVPARDDLDSLKKAHGILRTLRLGCPFTVRAMECRPWNDPDTDMRRLLAQASHRSGLARVDDDQTHDSAAVRLVARGWAGWWTPLTGGRGIRLTPEGMRTALRLERHEEGKRE